MMKNKPFLNVLLQKLESLDNDNADGGDNDGEDDEDECEWYGLWTIWLKVHDILWMKCY